MFNDKHSTFVQMIKLVATAVSCGKLPIQASVISYHLLVDQPSPEHLVQNTRISVYQNKQSWIINHINGLFFTEFQQLYHIRKCQNVRIINHWKKLFIPSWKNELQQQPNMMQELFRYSFSYCFFFGWFISLWFQVR